MIGMSKIVTKIGIKPTFKLENYFPFTLSIHVIDLGRGVPGSRVKEKEKHREEEAEKTG